MTPITKLLVGAPLFWYPVSFVHEIGHCLSVWVHGGTVERIVWHVGVFSQTIRSGSSSPIIDLWAGPVLGALLPVGLWSLWRWKIGPLPGTWFLRWFAAIALLGNGLYLGLGWQDDGCDGADIVRMGVHPAWLIGVGFVMAIAGWWFLQKKENVDNRSREGDHVARNDT